MLEWKTVEFPPNWPIDQFFNENIDENIERFSNIRRIYKYRCFINEDNIMLIETITNNQVQKGCNTIKNDIIENLK